MKYAFASAALVLCASAASAQVSLNNRVMQEIATVSASGTTTYKTVPARTMAPGSTAVYVMTYRNNGPKPASNLVINNPVAKDVEYVGAAEGSPAPQVSVDGGRTYGSLSGLRVANGQNATRPARASDVTNVRWTISGPVAPGSEGSVAYKGRVR